MSKQDDTIELSQRPPMQGFNIGSKDHQLLIVFLELKEMHDTDRPLIEEEEEHTPPKSSTSELEEELGDFVDFVNDHEVSEDKDSIFKSLEVQSKKKKMSR